MNSGVLGIFLVSSFIVSAFFKFSIVDHIFYSKKLLRRNFTKTCWTRAKEGYFNKIHFKKGKKWRNETIKSSKFCLIYDKSLCDGTLKIRNNWWTVRYYIQKVLEGQVTSYSLLTLVTFQNSYIWQLWKNAMHSKGDGFELSPNCISINTFYRNT